MAYRRVSSIRQRVRYATRGSEGFPGRRGFACGSFRHTVFGKTAPRRGPSGAYLTTADAGCPPTAYGIGSFNDHPISLSITECRATIPYNACNPNRRATLRSGRFPKNDTICSRNLNAAWDRFIVRVFRSGCIFLVPTIENLPPQGPFFYPKIPLGHSLRRRFRFLLRPSVILAQVS